VKKVKKQKKYIFFLFPFIKHLLVALSPIKALVISDSIVEPGLKGGWDGQYLVRQASVGTYRRLVMETVTVWSGQVIQALSRRKLGKGQLLQFVFKR
jgi:hypothetical protein